jgi:hypothetical protein
MKWRFFKYKAHIKGHSYPLMVSGPEVGFLFRDNGDSDSRLGNKSNNIKYTLQYHLSSYDEVTALQGIKLIDKSGRATVYKILGIPSIENSKPINLTAEIINPIIEQLTKNRAFNGDSAHKFGDDKLEEILYAMIDKSLIKTLDNERYWVEL